MSAYWRHFHQTVLFLYKIHLSQEQDSKIDVSHRFLRSYPILH
nr:MAG TPA: hypothetical protein [Caudoviricetes sp.]